MENNNETWKPVKDYEGLYEVSSLGRIKSLRRIKNNGIMNTFRRKSGYHFLCLGNGSAKNFSLHRLVATAFIPNPENKPQVNHINSDPSDNRLENLEWATSSENNQHTYDSKRRIPPGKHLYGINHWRTKKILCLLTGRVVTTKEACEFLSIYSPDLSRMLNGKKGNWTNYIYI